MKIAGLGRCQIGWLHTSHVPGRKWEEGGWDAYLAALLCTGRPSDVPSIMLRLKPMGGPGPYTVVDLRGADWRREVSPLCPYQGQSLWVDGRVRVRGWWRDGSPLAGR